MATLAEQNIGFALKIAKRYELAGRAAGLDLDDLISAATYGMVLAESKFDPAVGVKFITYAIHWIKREIVVAIYRGPLIHAPASVQSRRHAQGNPIPRSRFLRQTDAPDIQKGIFDRLAAPSVDPLAEREAWENTIGLLDLLSDLTPQEQHVIALRFGFDGGTGMTLKEIGDRMGLSRERIRQVEASALGKLRHKLSRRVA